MLIGVVRFLVLVLAFAVVVDAAYAAKKPETKKWIELRDNPVDYSDFEKRRKKNLAEGVVGVTRGLSLGYAARADLRTRVPITDDALTQKIADELKRLMPQGIVPPPMEIIVVDDLGIMSYVDTLPQDDEIIKAISSRAVGDFNAEATSGAGVIIPLGTLIGTKSLDELDFLLAHEASHVLYDHFDALETRELITQIAAVGLLVASLINRTGDADTARSVALSALGIELVNQLAGPAWDREQEFESDLLGFEMLMEAGMSADGAMNVMKQIELQEKRREEELDLICGPDGAGKRFFKRLLGGILGIKIPEGGADPNNPVCKQRSDLLAEWMDEHPDPEDRRKELIAHRKLWYNDIEPRAPTTFIDAQGKPYDNFVQFASPNGDANRRWRAYQGIKAVRDGNVALARSILNEILTRGYNEVLVPVLILHFLVLDKEGKRSEGLKHLDAATRAPQVEPHAFDMAIDEYEEDGRWSDVARIIELRQSRVGHSDGLLPKLIMAWRRAGQPARMDQALKSCRDRAPSEIVAQCEAAALPDPPPEPSSASPAGTPPTGSKP